MKPAPLDPLARHVLRALYELAELDVAAQPGVLARAVGSSLARGAAARFDHDVAEVLRVLRVLDERGLASAERARLSLLGLAQAARLPALGLEGERWISAARQQSRPRAAAARFDGASALPPLRRCAVPLLRSGAGDSRPELKRARRTS